MLEKFSFILLGLSALTILIILISPTVGALEVGDEAPEFNLPSSDGNTYSLSDMDGQWVILAWFPKAFTGG